MIPKADNSLFTLQLQTQPSLTYAIDIEHGKIRGRCDGLKAVRQTVYLILGIERYDCMIYSWNYGTELKALVGKSMDFVLSEAKRRISEALLQDDRITAVDGFAFQTERGRVRVTFTVHTIFGDMETETEVNV